MKETIGIYKHLMSVTAVSNSPTHTVPELFVLKFSDGTRLKLHATYIGKMEWV